jgi:hypothetical protein
MVPVRSTTPTSTAFVTLPTTSLYNVDVYHDVGVWIGLHLWRWAFYVVRTDDGPGGRQALLRSVPVIETLRVANQDSNRVLRGTVSNAGLLT